MEKKNHSVWRRKGKPELSSKQGAGDLVDGKGGPAQRLQVEGSLIWSLDPFFSRSLTQDFFLYLGPF